LCALPTIGIFLITQNSKPPDQLPVRIVWTLAGFFSCIVWVFMLAGELIVCLEALGIIWKLPSAYLGLTVLAWGNCIGDLFSICALARRGLGEMALAGAYGGPVFNLLFGLGLAIGYACLDCYPEPFHILFTTSSYISMAFCMFALVSSLIIVPLRGWRVEQSLGWFLLGLYALYMVVQFIYALET
jgi:solute carrier family 24 (sodium/potassium/calcium exchanger), member 6